MADRGTSYCEQRIKPIFAVLGGCQADYIAYMVLLLKKMAVWCILVCVNCVFLRSKTPVPIIVLLCEVSHRVSSLASVLTWRLFRTRFILQFLPYSAVPRFWISFESSRLFDR